MTVNIDGVEPKIFPDVDDVDASFLFEPFDDQVRGSARARAVVERINAVGRAADRGAGGGGHADIGAEGVPSVDAVGRGAGDIAIGGRAALRAARARGAFLRLSNLGSKFQEVLQVTKLLTVFDVSPTEAEGIKSFSK